MQFFKNFNAHLGFAAAVFLLVIGIYISFKTRFFQITNLNMIFKNTLGKLFSKKKNKTEKGLSSFQAFATSLAGTIGVGNIIGVSAAITIGGPGSILWMCLASFAGMIIKYAEIFLTIKHGQGPRIPNNDKYSFAPMNYIKKGTKSKLLPVLFAFLGIMTSLLMGNMTQINAVSQTCGPAFSIPKEIIGLALAGFIGFLLLGGLKKVLKTIELFLPIVGISYVVGGLIVILINYNAIVPSLILIGKTAFLPQAAAGGMLGAGLAKAFQEGIIKGVFSNEAGLGSAGLAHGSCVEKSPEEQGLWGAVEVFLDTIVISGITALTILCSGVWQNGGTNGVFESFEITFGKGGSIFTALCVLFFAVTSVMSWIYYGESCVAYLFKEKKTAIICYRVVFVVTIFAGAVISGETIWIFAELINSLMIFINMSGVIMLKDDFFKIFKRNILKKKTTCK